MCSGYCINLSVVDDTEWNFIDLYPPIQLEKTNLWVCPSAGSIFDKYPKKLFLKHLQWANRGGIVHAHLVLLTTKHELFTKQSFIEMTVRCACGCGPR